MFHVRLCLLCDSVPDAVVLLLIGVSLPEREATERLSFTECDIERSADELSVRVKTMLLVADLDGDQVTDRKWFEKDRERPLAERLIDVRDSVPESLPLAMSELVLDMCDLDRELEATKVVLSDGEAVRLHTYGPQQPTKLTLLMTLLELNGLRNTHGFPQIYSVRGVRR